MTMLEQLTTASAVRAYVDDISRSDRFPFPAVDEIIPLHGGVNYTFRLFFAGLYVMHDHHGNPVSARTAILKHAEKQIALTPHISFDLDRQLSEIQALTDLPKLLDSEEQVIHLPCIFFQDPDKSLFVMEDVSPPSAKGGPEREERQTISLQDTCRPSNQYYYDLSLAEQIGLRLGRFIAQLHAIKPPYLTRETTSGFPLKNMGARVVCAQQAFGEFVESIEKFGVELSLQRKDKLNDVMAEMTDRVLQASGNLIMGDFWVGNIIANISRSPIDGTQSLSALYVLDWEFFMEGATFVDLGHFAAEAWLYDYFYPRAEGETSFPRQLTAALFRAYRDNGGLIEARLIAIYIAGHIGCFLDYASWTRDVAVKKKTALLALDLIDIALTEDWSQLKKDSFLFILFRQK